MAIHGATFGARHCQASYRNTVGVWIFGFESFSQTETDFAVEVCEAVCDVWQPQNGQPVILNLPATVESSTPNLYADQVEYFCRHLKHRKDVIISLHTHNDRAVRGGGVRAWGWWQGRIALKAHCWVMASARATWTFWSMAMNLYTQGVNPELDLSQVSEIMQVVTRMQQLSKILDTFILQLVLSL